MEALRDQAGMCADLWNALLSMCEITREFRVWYYTQKGPAFFGIDGKLRVLRLSEVWTRRRMFGGRIRAADILSSRAECIDLPDDAQRRFLPSEFDMGYWISEMLAECPEWQALSTWTPRRVATSLNGAWQAFFRRVRAGEEAGYPRYKSRHRADAVPHRCVSGCKIVKSDRHETSWLVKLKGVPGDVWARGRIPADVNEWMDADIRLDGDGAAISFAVAIEERRQTYGRLKPITVRFDMIDGFAAVNGNIETPPDLIRVKDLDDRRAEMQAAFHLRWPRGKRWSDDEWRERCEQKEEIGRLASRIARIRRNALHVWSCNLVERASVVTIYKPRIKDHTKTPRGNEKSWGANVEVVSSLNRNTHSYAPAMAAQMLEYKAKEIGIPCEIIEDRAPNIAIGEKLVAAGKAMRKTKRAIRKNDNEYNQQGTGRTGRGDRGRNGAGTGSHASQGRP